MAVTIKGMFGDGKTYFANSPVVIDIEGLEWGETVTSPFTVVRLEVLHDGMKIGEFRADTGGQTSISFDISSALRSIWADYEYGDEVAAANAKTVAPLRAYREYSLIVQTEYIDSTDGSFVTTTSDEFTGGRCAIGGLTEWERSILTHKEDADMSYWEHSNLRNGDASTKPTSTPERVGRLSITSWVDVQNAGTRSHFYPPTANPGGDGTADHAPIVLRDDNQEYADFLFVNRRGAVETCSVLTKEALDIPVETKQYARIKRPAFKPSRSLMALSSGGRRSWSMSTGYQTREWTEWWTVEFLMSHQWWMLYQGSYVPVIVTPAKKENTIYDRSKQQMTHVDFTVTLALEG